MSTDPTATDRALRARAAAHQSWANTGNRSARTQRARDAFLRQFEQQVDPDGLLSSTERARRAEHARKAYFLVLSRNSAAARRAATSQPDRGRTS